MAATAVALPRIGHYAGPFQVTCLSPMRRIILLSGIVLLSVCLLSACGSQEENQPRKPPIQPNQQGVTLDATLLTDARETQSVLGVDAKRAGLLAVRLRVHAVSGETFTLLPAQTVLIDAQRQAWPLLSAVQVRNRLAAAGNPPALPAPPTEWASVTGFAVYAETGTDADTRLKQVLQSHIPHNLYAWSGQAGTAILVFPGREISVVADKLHLTYLFGSRVVVVDLPLQTQ